MGNTRKSGVVTTPITVMLEVGKIAKQFRREFSEGSQRPENIERMVEEYERMSSDEKRMVLRAANIMARFLSNL